MPDLNVLDLVKGLGGVLRSWATAMLPLRAQGHYISKGIIEVKRTKRRSHSFRTRWRRRQQRGFTLIEMIVIVAVIGIMGAIAAPSFASMMDGMKVNQAVTDLQTALQDTQRQAIRKSQVCSVQVSKGNSSSKPKKKSGLTGNCLTSGSPSFDADIALATNIQSAIPLAAPDDIEIKYGTQGSAEFAILSTVLPPLLPADPTGKIVVFIPNATVKKKCVAISSTLGLTRTGTYTGSITPADITDKGICTALDWTKQ